MWNRHNQWYGRWCRYCKPCVLEKPSRTITLKPPARKSTRKRTQLDYANLNSGVESDPTRWLRVIQSKSIKSDQFKRMKGADVGIEWLENDESAMHEPIVIENPEGLGIKMPDPNCTVSDVANIVGRETPVEVIGALMHSCVLPWCTYAKSQTWLRSPMLQDGRLANGRTTTTKSHLGGTKSGTSSRSRYPALRWETRFCPRDWYENWIGWRSFGQARGKGKVTHTPKFNCTV